MTTPHTANKKHVLWHVDTGGDASNLPADMLASPTTSVVAEQMMDIPPMGSEDFFLPTPAQRRAKSLFWARISTGPLADDPILPSLHILMKILNHDFAPSTLREWWKQAGWAVWFFNSHDDKERLECVYAQWVESLMERMKDPALSHKDFLQYGKMLAVLTNKLPRVVASSASTTSHRLDGASEETLLAIIEEEKKKTT